jgi:hypothetical protein
MESSKQSAIGNRRSAIGNWQKAKGKRQKAMNFQRRKFDYKFEYSRTIHHWPFTIHVPFRGLGGVINSQSNRLKGVNQTVDL